MLNKDNKTDTLDKLEQLFTCDALIVATNVKTAKLTYVLYDNYLADIDQILLLIYKLLKSTILLRLSIKDIIVFDKHAHIITEDDDVILLNNSDLVVYYYDQTIVLLYALLQYKQF